MFAIKDYRKKTGVTQSDLAIALGVTQATVAMWETGEALPRADKLPKLAKILNCTVDDLFKKKVK